MAATDRGLLLSMRRGRESGGKERKAWRKICVTCKERELERLRRPAGLSSHCLICGQTHYDEVRRQCRRCGGLCILQENRILAMIGRPPMDWKDDTGQQRHTPRMARAE